MPVLLTAVRETLGRGGEIGATRRDGCLSLLDFIPCGFHLIAKSAGSGDDLRSVIFGQAMRSDSIIYALLRVTVEELGDLALEGLVFQRELQVLHAAFIYSVSPVYRTKEREFLGVMTAQADIAVHLERQQRKAVWVSE